MRLLLVLGLVACNSAPRSQPAELGDSHVAPRVEPQPVRERARLRYDMRQRLVDLDRAFDAVHANQLDEARIMGFAIARTSSGKTRRAAAALSNAPDLETAGRLAERLTTTCADCHRELFVRAKDLPSGARSLRATNR
jgi:hypothetical protein